VVSAQSGSGSWASALDRSGPRAPSSQGLSGITVELEDASGNVLATTVTDSNGHYRFDQLTGLSATGEYTVRLVPPSGFRQTWKNPATILISRGDINRSAVDFVLAPTK
jgi:hypothetical protein